MDEEFKEPTRAWRRRQKERKVQQAYRRGLESNWRRKEPEKYWFLDPDDEDDMMDIWCMDSEHREPYGSKRGLWAIYIIGQGMLNPPEELDDGYYGKWTPKVPYLTDEEIQDDILLEAKKVANHQAWHTYHYGGTAKKNCYTGGAGKKAWKANYFDAVEQYEECGLEIELKRLKRRFTRG